MAYMHYTMYGCVHILTLCQQDTVREQNINFHPLTKSSNEFTTSTFAYLISSKQQKQIFNA